MHHSDGNFEEEEDDDFEILPVLLLSLLTRRTKWEHQQLAWLDHVKKLQHEKMFTHRHIGYPLKHLILLSICCMEISPTILQNMALHLVKIPWKQRSLLQ